MALFPFSKGSFPLRPGEWSLVKRRSGPPTARICCPSCRKSGVLDHKIADNGIITPSIVCPHEPCEFHEWGKLLDWDPEG